RARPTRRARPPPGPGGPSPRAAAPPLGQPQLAPRRDQLRNRARLDEVNLPRDERGERLAVDPVLHASSLPLICINSGETPKRARSAASPTRPVHLRLEVFGYSAALAAGNRPVSRAHRSPPPPR